MEVKLDGLTFWVLIQKEKLILFSEKDEAIEKLGKVLPTEGDSSLAELTYTHGDEEGTFGVEPVSWKDISLALLARGSKKK